MASNAFPRHEVITFIWDFDKTLTPNYMQNPLFAAFDVEPQDFWDETNEEVRINKQRGVEIDPDGVYLNRMIQYVQAGIFKDLTRAKLRELGAQIEFVPGVIDFFERSKAFVQSGEYAKNNLKVEHWIVSTGLRPMIEGSAIGGLVAGVRANDFIDVDLQPGFKKSRSPIAKAPEPGVILRPASMMNNTGKTAGIYEISKGVGIYPGVNVNTNVSEEDLRVPIKNMIYIADGPSDVPAFAVVRKGGGRTLAVYAGGDRVDAHYESAANLQDQGRVHSMAEADYTAGSPADRWLMRNLKMIANDIVASREQYFSGKSGAPGHVPDLPRAVAPIEPTLGLEIGKNFQPPASAGSSN